MNPKRSQLDQVALMPKGEVVANFKQYTDALAYVDNLIKHDFPATSVAIVGSDLRTVERVRGKVTYTGLAMAGALFGSGLGLVFGLIFSVGNANLKTEWEATTAVGQAVVVGAGCGMLLNVIRFSLARTKREFVSQSTVVASKYQVQVPANLADQARAVPGHGTNSPRTSSKD